jgi:hypothetical protein
VRRPAIEINVEGALATSLIDAEAGSLVYGFFKFVTKKPYGQNPPCRF